MRVHVDKRSHQNKKLPNRRKGPSFRVENLSGSSLALLFFHFHNCRGRYDESKNERRIMSSIKKTNDMMYNTLKASSTVGGHQAFWILLRNSRIKEQKNLIMFHGMIHRWATYRRKDLVVLSILVSLPRSILVLLCDDPPQQLQHLQIKYWVHDWFVALGVQSWQQEWKSKVCKGVVVLVVFSAKPTVWLNLRAIFVADTVDGIDDMVCAGFLLLDQCRRRPDEARFFHHHGGAVPQLAGR